MMSPWKTLKRRWRGGKWFGYVHPGTGIGTLWQCVTERRKVRYMAKEPPGPGSKKSRGKRGLIKTGWWHILLRSRAQITTLDYCWCGFLLPPLFSADHQERDEGNWRSRPLRCYRVFVRSGTTLCTPGVVPRFVIEGRADFLSWHICRFVRFASKSLWLNLDYRITYCCATCRSCRYSA